LKAPRQSLFCQIGDLLVFTRRVETSAWPGEPAQVVEAGDVYEAVSLTENGWDLERRQGGGPSHLRLLNSQLSKYVVRDESVAR
jgi:hypothetical protein